MSYYYEEFVYKGVNYSIENCTVEKLSDLGIKYTRLFARNSSLPTIYEVGNFDNKFHNNKDLLWSLFFEFLNSANDYDIEQILVQMPGYEKFLTERYNINPVKNDTYYSLAKLYIKSWLNKNVASSLFPMYFAEKRFVIIENAFSTFNEEIYVSDKIRAKNVLTKEEMIKTFKDERTKLEYCYNNEVYKCSLLPNLYYGADFEKSGLLQDVHCHIDNMELHKYRKQCEKLKIYIKKNVPLERRFVKWLLK